MNTSNTARPAITTTPGYSTITATGNVPRVTIHNELAVLEQSLATAHATADELMNVLSPVLVPVPPDLANAGTPVQPISSSDIGVRVAAAERSVQGLIGRMQAILARQEVQ